MRQSVAARIYLTIFAFISRNTYGFALIEQYLLGSYVCNDREIGRYSRKICARCCGSTAIMSTDLANTDPQRISRVDVKVFWVVIIETVEKVTKFGLPVCQTHINDAIQGRLISSLYQYGISLTHDRRVQTLKD